MEGEPQGLPGKSALVVGGTGGIGRALARLLARRGVRLTITGGNSQERLKAALAEIREAGGQGEGFLIQGEAEDAAEQILARSPEPDILVCAWGPFWRGPLEETDPAAWRHLTWANLAFPGALVSGVLPGMIRRTWGRILLFGGTNTDVIRGFTSTAAYSAAKTALGVLAKSAARCAGPRGVTCNVVCPGLTATEYLDEGAQAYNREKSPGGRPLQADQIARFALEILEHPPVNGAVIPVDQGIML
jgi:NAD(P)-dependent dehydrogenase (short-subunit alcohol dehydrogenase family)